MNKNGITGPTEGPSLSLEQKQFIDTSTHVRNKKYSRSEIMETAQDSSNCEALAVSIVIILYFHRYCCYVIHINAYDQNNG